MKISKKTSIITLILARYSVAILLSVLPLFFNLKKDWYIIPLIVFGFIFQLLLATFQMLTFFKKLSNNHKKTQL
jgi:hypothetical protein